MRNNWILTRAETTLLLTGLALLVTGMGLLSEGSLWIMALR
jgi:VIT1/CCC1 family predicted Fe2+/Mn2+ transporter